MIPVRHVVIVVEKETTNLLNLLPNLTVESIKSIDGLINFSYAYDDQFNPDQLWADGMAIALVNASIYPQLVMGEKTSYLMTRGLMAFMVCDLEYLGFTLENIGPKQNGQSAAPAMVTLTCTFKSENLSFYFLDDL